MNRAQLKPAEQNTAGFSLDRPIISSLSLYNSISALLSPISSDNTVHRQLPALLTFMECWKIERK